MKRLFWAFYTTISLLILISSIQADWEKTFGGVSDDVGNSVYQTEDGGYIIAGTTKSFGAGYNDVYLVKTDALGNEEWYKTFGGADHDYGNSVQQTKDGGYIVVGKKGDCGYGYDDVYLIKTDASGDKQWEQVFGGVSHQRGYCVQQTEDGGYIIVGESGTYRQVVYLVKTDDLGRMQWEREFQPAHDHSGRSVQQTESGGYIIAGFANHEDADVYLIKTDASGNLQWEKTFGGTDNDYGNSVQQTKDGGYIITGRKGSGGYKYDVYLIKTDTSGDKQWEKTFGGEFYSDYGQSVYQATDGGYIIAGYTESFGAGGYDVYLIKTDASGNEQWEKTFGGADNDYGNSVQQTRDGDYIIAGYTESFGAGKKDVYLIRAEPSFDLHDTVGVSGTGDDGLSLRDDYGLSSTKLKVVPDGWTFRITDGNSIFADGYTWWQVREEKHETSPVEGWVAENWLTKVSPENLVPPNIPDYFSSNQDEIEEAIAWAIAQEGKTDWAGWCLKFVANSFGRENSGYQHPNEMKEALGDEFYSYTECWNPPRGALIFFSALDKYEEYGHIGISLGNQGIVHSYDKVRVDTKVSEINKGIVIVENLGYIDSYIGWAFPPEEWIDSSTISGEIDITLNYDKFEKGEQFKVTAEVENTGTEDILGTVGVWFIGFGDQLLIFKAENISMPVGFDFAGDIIDITFPGLPVATYGILALFFDAKEGLLDYDLEFFNVVAPSSTMAKADIKKIAKEFLANISLETVLETQVSSLGTSSYMSYSVENSLEQNYPNPFNPETWIPYQLKDTADVTISIYDISGQLVRKLNLGQQKAGFYVTKDKAVYWDGRNSFGEKVSSGLYFYTLQAGNYTTTKRMLILK